MKGSVPRTDGGEYSVLEFIHLASALQAGGLLYVSGHGPLLQDKTYISGQVGAELSVEEGVAAARQVGLAMLATLRAKLGSLDRVARVVKVNERKETSS